MQTLPWLAVTSGEPAGIGPDVCLDLAGTDLPYRVVVLGDKTVLQARAQLLGKNVHLRDYQPDAAPQTGVLDVYHLPVATAVVPGQLAAANAAYVLDLLDAA